MSKGYIAVIDSGIGGFSVLKELIKAMPNESYLYLGDNGNAPYGNRTDDDLLYITVSNVEFVKRFGVKAIVFACNTISARVLPKVKYYYPDIEFFGVFPPVETSVLKRKNTLLLCTPSTAKNYKDGKYLTVLPLPYLAKDIENNMFSLEKVNVVNHIKQAIRSHDLLEKKDNVWLTTNTYKKSCDPHSSPFDVVILGCTHYNFLKNQIFNHFQPPAILGGEIFTANMVKKRFQQKMKFKNNSKNQVIFIGDFAYLNNMFYDKVLRDQI